MASGNSFWIIFSASIFEIPYHETRSRFGPTWSFSEYGPSVPSNTKSVDMKINLVEFFLQASTIFLAPSTFIRQQIPSFWPLCFSAASTSVKAEKRITCEKLNFLKKSSTDLLLVMSTGGSVERSPLTRSTLSPKSSQYLEPTIECDPITPNLGFSDTKVLPHFLPTNLVLIFLSAFIVWVINLSWKIQKVCWFF